MAADARADIAVRGVTFAFAAETVLADISLDIPAGRFVSLIGPSGCGKTTLLKIIGGLLDPARGSVRYGERSAAAMLEAGRIGLVFQEPSLLPWRTALGNAAFLCEMTPGWSRAAARERGRAMLELVGLAAAADKYPRQLSGGMRQRVAIARVLALDSPIMLMDEPFGALDALTRRNLQDELLRIWTELKKTILFVTHGIDESIYLADRIVVMTYRPGRVKTIVPVPLERPRDVSSPQFNDLKRDLSRMVMEEQDRREQDEARQVAGAD